MRTSLRNAWAALPAILLATAALAPFHDKAFTADDTTLMLQARHALVDPIHPAAFEMAWDGDVPVRATGATGPVVPWLLVPAAAAGAPEAVAHLTTLALLLVALAATVSLGLRLGLTPGWACAGGVLLAATPVALAMAGTAMPDVPAMALGVAGLERLAAWRDRRRADQAILASLLLGLAPLARPHLALLLGIGLLLLAGDPFDGRAWRRVPARGWAILALAPALAATLLALTRDPAASTGAGGVIARAAAVGRILPNATAFSAHWVLLVPLAIPWLALRAAAIARRWQVLALATPLALLGTRTPHGKVFGAAAAVLGAAVLVDVLCDAWKRRDGTQLTLGLWLLVPLPVVTYLHFPSKYLLASAPAAALLVARALSRDARLAPRWASAGAAALGLLLGIAILRADAAFAGVGRRAAAELIGPRVAAGQRVWYAGHWGFQWYAEQAGARYLAAAPPYPARGDLLVTTLRSMPSRTARLYPDRTLLGVIDEAERGGRIMCPEAGAGFYSNGFGFFPWSWGAAVVDRFELWRLEQDGPAPAR